MIRDVRWQLFKLASLLVTAPPLFAFPIGDPVVDRDGHSLLGRPLIPGRDWEFRRSERPSLFEQCDCYDLEFDGNLVGIGVREGAVRWVSYDYQIYRETAARRMRKLRYLLHEHAAAGVLRELVDNGSAVLFGARNREQLAFYAYLVDNLVVYAGDLKRVRG